MTRQTIRLSALGMVSFFACGGEQGSLSRGDGGEQGSLSRGGKVQVTASGEELALLGYGYPPASSGAPAFVDGWEVRFTKLLVTVANVSLSESPDSKPTDQSATGKKVAQLDGPFAVDLAKGGDIIGKSGGGEQAVALGPPLDSQNLNGNAPFDPTVRYAFGYELVKATEKATRVQMKADDADYAEMIEKQWTVMYVGTATWKGDSTCKSSIADFDFAALPKVVNFRLGFASPSKYINCQNPSNDSATPLSENEEYQRGIQVKANETVVAQVTYHTDHIFWESIVHDSPAHFDQLAAIATDGGQAYSVTADSAVGVNYKAFTFGGKPLPWRSCLDGYTPPTDNPEMGFDSSSIPYDPGGQPGTALRDYRDYMAYNQSTSGHLNADGLCFTERLYPSPR